MLSLFDSHAHWCDEKFDEDRDALLKALPQKGVMGVLNPGSSMADSALVVDLCKQYDLMYGGVGVCPHDAQSFEEKDLLQLKKWLSLPKIKAVGEIGIDYYYEQYPRVRQWQVFEAQWDLAVALHKPVILHLREAYGDMEKFLSEQQILPQGVFHCYSGSVEFAKQVLNKGFYISLAGPVTYKNAVHVQEVAAYVPLDRLLMETDSPYLPPHPLRGQRNESANLTLIAQKIAEIKGISIETLALRTTANACCLFSIDMPLA